MKDWRAWTCAVAIAALVAMASGLGTAPLPARAGIPQRIFSSSSLPPPHLGYGINVRDHSYIDSLFAPLGFEWLKLWEEYDPRVPTTRYPYQILFLIDCTQRSGDLEEWGNDVEAIVRDGRGLVEAYEICNEPNRVGWLKGTASWPPPDPGLYAQMLKIAYERIKAVDPAAIVVSAGLAPVGRIEGECNEWSGNDCSAMDEWEYAHQMFLWGAGDYFDAFGYHPYGFAYEPERALDELPPSDNGNGFTFRGVEVMHDLLEQHGLGHKPIWATEFSWLRDPSYDDGYNGVVPGWCHSEPGYRDVFDWMDVPEVQQANYITRAFQYADEYWPWMGAMFVWNLDWHDYGWLCEPSRYFSVRKDDGTDEGIPAPAYYALISMTKRPGHFGPRLAVEPPVLTFMADVDEPGVRTGVVVPLNMGYRVFTWTASVAVGMQVTGTGTVGIQVTPTLAITTGLQGTPLTITVDSTGYAIGTFIGLITVTATTTDVLDAPQALPVMLRVVPEVYRVYLPVALCSAP